MRAGTAAPIRLIARIREARELSGAASGCLHTVQASVAAIKAVSSMRIYKKEKKDDGWDDRGPVRRSNLVE